MNLSYFYTFEKLNFHFLGINIYRFIDKNNYFLFIEIGLYLSRRYACKTQLVLVYLTFIQ